MPAERDPTPHRSSTAPLAVWLGVQLVAVAVVTLRVPLAAAYPPDAERLAAYWVFGVQVVAASMLFPFLLRDVRLAVQVICAAIPFQAAAFGLAGKPWSESLWPGAVAIGWLMVLACWGASLESLRGHVFAVAVASCLTLGGGALRYLRIEFGTGGTSPGGGVESASPLLTTFAAIDGHTPLPGIIAIAAIGLAGVLFTFTRRGRARPTDDTSGHHS